MNPRYVLIIALLTVAVALVWWLNPGSNETELQTQERENEVSEQRPISAEPQSAEEISPQPIDSAVELNALRENLAIATGRVASAAERVDALEVQVQAIEMQIADIQARGDDPVDHAHEVMPYLEPVLAEFLDAQAELEAALAEEAIADAELTAAMAD